MVRVGIVGTGFGQQVHLPAFQACSGARIIGIASRDSARAAAAAAQHQLPRTFENWTDLIESDEIDAVTVATPPSSHASITLAAARAGKAVLCEKPLACTTDEAVAMLKGVQAAGVVHMTAFEFREIPAWRLTKRIVEAGRPGELRHVNVRWIVSSWADPKRPWSWRADVQQGGGTLGALVVHVFDALLWMFGPVRAVTAQLATRISARPDDRGIQRAVTAEDCCHVLLELTDGTPVSVTASAVAANGFGFTMEIFGARGTVVLCNDAPGDYARGFVVREALGGADFHELPLPSDGLNDQQFSDGRIAPFRALAQRFVTAIERGGESAEPSFEAGLRAQELMDAVRLLDRRQRPPSVREFRYQ